MGVLLCSEHPRGYQDSYRAVVAASMSEEASQGYEDTSVRREDDPTSRTDERIVAVIAVSVHT